MNLKPIFIGGCDRSGTTLLGATLARFPGVVALPESQFIHETARLLQDKAATLEEVAEHISNHPRFAAWRDAGCAPPQQHLAAGDKYRDFVDRLIREYARATGVENVKAFVDHSPDNSLNVRALRPFFNDLQFVHVIRDGRGVAASLMPQDWGPNDILEMARYWQESIAAGFAACDYLGAQAQSLRFEALLDEEEATLTSIASLAGAASFDAANETTSYRKPGYADTTHELVGARPSPERATAWRTKLSAREIELFEYYAGPLLEALGYARQYPRGAARKASRLEKAVISAKRWLSYRRNKRKRHMRFSA